MTFFTTTGGLSERFVAGMDWSQVAASRAIGAPPMAPTARPYGLWRDRVMGWAPDAGAGSRLALDGFALLSVQVPLYVAIIAAGGARGDELLRGALGAAATMLALGRPYGLWLEQIRRWFGLSPGGGQAPMSLGG